METVNLIRGLSLRPIIVIVAIVLMIVLFFSIFKSSIRLILKLLINAAVGVVLLLVFNYLGSFIGVILPVNWGSALTAGLLGLPGIVLLLVIKWLAP